MFGIGRNKEDSHGFLFLILCLTLPHDLVMRKLSSILSTMRTNFRQGTAKVSTSAGTQGRAETSNIPNTARGSVDLSSFKGKSTIEPHPAQKGAMTPLGCGSSKLASVKRPERTSGGAKKIATKGLSPILHVVKSFEDNIVSRCFRWLLVFHMFFNKFRRFLIPFSFQFARDTIG